MWIADYDQRRGWQSWGCRSCAHWLNWKCGMSLHSAQERVRTGRALLDLSAITDQFLAGRISYSKVRALTRVADADNETTLLELAVSMTASQLERACAACRRPGSDRRAAEAFASRRVTRRSLGGGLSRITLDLPDDASQLVWAALEAKVEEIITDAIVESDTTVSEATAERGGAAAMRADAMADIALDAAAGHVVDHDRDRRVGHLHLVAELDLDSADDAPPLVTLNETALATSVARRWLCDIDVSTMFESRDGVPLGETAKNRTVPRRMRRLLDRRDDGCCRFPGCAATRHLHAHHIRHWVDGGPTRLANLILLCRFHHRLVHHSGWRIEGTPGIDMVFIAPRGEHATVEPARTTDPGAIPRRHRRAHLKPRLECNWDGSGPDYHELAAWLTSTSTGR